MKGFSILSTSPEGQVLPPDQMRVGVSFKRVWLAGCVALALAAFFAYLTPFANDDAWITYRYAENLANGLGFTFNAGERVLGTSTPLYTLLLALGDVVGLPVPLLSRTFGFLSMFGILAGVYLLIREAHSELAAMMAVVLLIPLQLFHRIMTYGMETPLYVVSIVFAFYNYAKGRFVWAAALAACSLLFRLDGAAVLGAMGLTHLLLHRRLPPLKSLGVYLALILPWFLFSYFYFGSVFPQSFLAKRVHSETLYRLWMYDWLISLALTPFAVVGGIVLAVDDKRRAASLPLLFWTLAYVIAYVFSNLFGHEWYKTPLCVSLAGLGAVGLLTVVLALVRRVRMPILLPLLLGSLTLVLVDGDLRLVQRRLRKESYDFRDTLERARMEASQWMDQNLPKDAVIVAGGIGHPGYITRRRIIDASGLISPEVVKPGLPPAWPRFLPYVVEHFRPEYVFVVAKTVPNYMAKEYSIIRSWETGYYAGPFLLMQRSTEAGRGPDASAQ